MTSPRSAKPLVSSLLALCFVLSFVLPFLQYDYLAGPITPFDPVQAGAIRYGVIGLFLLLWLGVQLFWKAPVEATKLAMAASATIIWLALVFFYAFKPPLGYFNNVNYQGAVAFFALMGGLGIVLLWTRFLADDIHF
ncbi:MAG: hypothetical protein ACRDHP_17295 [Ktedonobacterales bacterium]